MRAWFASIDGARDEQLSIEADVPRRLIDRFRRRQGAGVTHALRRFVVVAVLLAGAACARNPRPRRRCPAAPAFPDYPRLDDPGRRCAVTPEAPRAARRGRGSGCRLATCVAPAGSSTRACAARRRSIPPRPGSGSSRSPIVSSSRRPRGSARRWRRTSNIFRRGSGWSTRSSGSGTTPTRIARDGAGPRDRSQARGASEPAGAGAIQGSAGAHRRGAAGPPGRPLRRGRTRRSNARWCCRRRAPSFYRELAALEAARGALDAAEDHARRAVAIDAERRRVACGTRRGARGARALPRRGSRLRQGRRPSIPARRGANAATALREKANASAMPAEFRDLPSAATVTRAQVAALIGIATSTVVVERAPKRRGGGRDRRPGSLGGALDSAGDPGRHHGDLAEPHLPARRDVRRVDLAQVVSQLLAVAGGRSGRSTSRAGAPRGRGLSTFRRPVCSTTPAALAIVVRRDGHAATAIASSRPARSTGAELVAAIDRIEQLAGR